MPRVKPFACEEKKQIVKSCIVANQTRYGYTDEQLAKYMGVSVKTVESWEAGRNHPEGAACRLLTLTRNDPTFPQSSGIVVR